jgi:hypothetical protein
MVTSHLLKRYGRLPHKVLTKRKENCRASKRPILIFKKGFAFSDMYTSLILVSVSMNSTIGDRYTKVRQRAVGPNIWNACEEKHRGRRVTFENVAEVSF